MSDTWKVVRPFGVGGSCGILATCVIQPMDMIKVRIQLGGVGTNPVAVAGKIVAESGVGGLYKGLSAGILRQVFYGTSRLGIFRTLTNKYTPTDGSKMPFLTTLGCSVVAGGLGAIIGTPADAALIRMQSDSTLPEAQRRHYKNGIDAMTRMLREEGMAGFFSGAGPTVVRGLAINVGMLASYGNYKDFFGPMIDGKDGQVNRFFSGFLSGWTAATVALPFDLIKTLIQKQKPDPKTGKLPYAGMVDCAKQTIAKGGVTSLWTGYPTFVARICPHIMLTWVFMDHMNDALKSRGL